MKKANKILTLVVLVLSIALAYLVIKFVVMKYVNVNEGNYRISYNKSPLKSGDFLLYYAEKAKINMK